MNQYLIYKDRVILAASFNLKEYQEQVGFKMCLVFYPQLELQQLKQLLEQQDLEALSMYPCPYGSWGTRVSATSLCPAPQESFHF